MKKSFFIGHTARNWTLKNTKNGNIIGSNDLAVQEVRNGEKKTDFFHLLAFGKVAQGLEKYVPKGTKIFVECKPEINFWEKDGQRHESEYHIVLGWEYAQTKNSAQAEQPAPQPTQRPVQQPQQPQQAPAPQPQPTHQPWMDMGSEVPFI